MKDISRDANGSPVEDEKEIAFDVRKWKERMDAAYAAVDVVKAERTAAVVAAKAAGFSKSEIGMHFEIGPERVTQILREARV